MSADQLPGRGARVHEQGYRRYEGARLGHRHAMRTVFVHTIRHIMGFKRRARAKVLPTGLIALAVLPAIGFTAALLILPDFAAQLAEEVLPGPEDYVGGIAFLTYLGAALAGPAALCGDRLHGSLTLYLASPLTRRTYLLGKAAAVVAFLATITVLPSLVYVLGLALAGVQDTTLVGVLVDVAQVLAAGTVIALGYAALSMAAASITDRAGAAAGLIVGFSIVVGIVGGILIEELDVLPRAFGVINVNLALTDAATHLHAKGTTTVLRAVPAWLGAGAWIAGLGWFVTRRYERLQVTR